MIRANRSTQQRMVLDFASGTIDVAYADIEPLIDQLPDPGAPEIIAKIENYLYNLFDVRIRLNQLPADDPDRQTDPARPNLFWEGNGGNRELVSRPYYFRVKWVPERQMYDLDVSKRPFV